MSHPRPSPVALGVASFAAVMLLVTAVLQFLAGLAAVLADEVYVTGLDYTYRLDVTTWGWIHLVIGVLGVAVALGIIAGRSVALGVGIGLAAVGVVSQFLFLPYYPFWSALLIALYTLVIWALAQRMSEAR